MACILFLPLSFDQFREFVHKIMDLPAIAYSDLNSDVIETWKTGFSEVLLAVSHGKKSDP